MEKIKPIKELELYMIRHGQSMGNAGYDKEELTLKEENDPYLTRLGLQQAQKAGTALSSITFDAVYSSALLRAVRTAAEILKMQAEKLPLNFLRLLTEMGVNTDYKGADMEEILEIYETAVLAEGLSQDSPLICHNNSDDEAGLFERAEKTINMLRENYKNGEKIALVCHAAFMTYLVFYIMGYKNAVPDFDIDFNNTSVTKVVFYKKGTNKYGDVVFEYINSTRHLTDKY